MGYEREKWRKVIDGLMIAGSVAMVGGIVFGAFSDRKKDRHGQKVGWRCEYPGCEEELESSGEQEFHHKVPVARARRLGWSQEQIDSYENMELDCLRHHLTRHEEMGDTGGAAWIRERIRRKETGYGEIRVRKR